MKEKQGGSSTDLKSWKLFDRSKNFGQNWFMIGQYKLQCRILCNHKQATKKLNYSKNKFKNSILWTTVLSSSDCRVSKLL